MTMSARYAHTTDRVRQILKTLEMTADPCGKLRASVYLLFKRATLLRKAILLVVLSAACSGLLVLTCTVEAMFGTPLETLKQLFLLCSVGLIVFSTFYFSLEVNISLKALELTLPPNVEEKKRIKNALTAPVDINAHRRAHFRRARKNPLQPAQGNLPYRRERVFCCLQTARQGLLLGLVLGRCLRRRPRRRTVPSSFSARNSRPSRCESSQKANLEARPIAAASGKRSCTIVLSSFSERPTRKSAPGNPPSRGAWRRL